MLVDEEPRAVNLILNSRRAARTLLELKVVRVEPVVDRRGGYVIAKELTHLRIKVLLELVRHGGRVGLLSVGEIYRVVDYQPAPVPMQTPDALLVDRGLRVADEVDDEGLEAVVEPQRVISIPVPGRAGRIRCDDDLSVTRRERTQRRRVARQRVSDTGRRVVVQRPAGVHVVLRPRAPGQALDSPRGQTCLSQPADRLDALDAALGEVAQG